MNFFWDNIPLICCTFEVFCMLSIGALLAFGGIKAQEQPGIFFGILGCILFFGICNFVRGGCSGIKFAANKIIKKEDK